MIKDELEQERGLELANEIAELVRNAKTTNHGTDIISLVSVIAAVHHSVLLHVPQDLRDEVRKQAEDAIMNQVREALQADLSGLVKQYLSNH